MRGKPKGTLLGNQPFQRFLTQFCEVAAEPVRAFAARTKVLVESGAQLLQHKCAELGHAGRIAWLSFEFVSLFEGTLFGLVSKGTKRKPTIWGAPKKDTPICWFAG